MAYTLPDLPYANEALEPHIDARTMEIHHTKHHQAYITKANAALESHADLAAKSVEDLLSDLSAVPEDIRAAIRNMRRPRQSFAILDDHEPGWRWRT